MGWTVPLCPDQARDLGSSLPRPVYASLFESIGRNDLQQRLLAFLNEICGVDSLHFFRLSDGRPDIACGLSLDGKGSAQDLAQTYMRRSLWRGDRDMNEGSSLDCEQPTLYRLEARQAPTSELRDFYHSQKLIERLMVCGKTPMGVVGFSIMRSAPRDLTSKDHLSGMNLAFSEIFPIVSKHLEMVSQSRRLVESLTSLALIEQNLSVTEVGLSQREIQVAARFLYGLSASCIASDLGIGTETIHTHRKRLYGRLGIGCHHELLLWYLRQYVGGAGNLATAS
ncbi:MAG: hypothetical protein COC10_04090 [Sphingobium sp.]|nr:MAG: hypothetical protein COC10_04090 [Sphingobium sp.]